MTSLERQIKELIVNNKLTQVRTTYQLYLREQNKKANDYKQMLVQIKRIQNNVTILNYKRRTKEYEKLTTEITSTLNNIKSKTQTLYT